MSKSKKLNTPSTAGERGDDDVVRTDPVAEEESGLRLDRWLALHVAGQSRARLQALIKQGRVSHDGATVSDASQGVKPGQTFVVSLPAPEPATPLAEKIPLTVVYEDDDLIVIDKPAGLVVHPAPGNASGTLVNALLEHCGDSLSGIGGVRRPGIVHRLDKDTSGLLVVAKTDVAHRALVEDFSARRVHRVYQAVVWGVPKAAAGVIETNIGRSSRDRKKMAVVKDSGRAAITHYKLLEPFGDLAALVECRLGTGRTHQIRVHMAHLGHPVVGDATYGRPPAAKLRHWPAVRSLADSLQRQALHAGVLGFRHPTRAEDLSFSSALPLELERLVATLRIRPI
jgi:23S rRNA pseudouridine1911/1915/1917 synthase